MSSVPFSGTQFKVLFCSKSPPRYAPNLVRCGACGYCKGSTTEFYEGMRQVQAPLPIIRVQHTEECGHPGPGDRGWGQRHSLM